MPIHQSVLRGHATNYRDVPIGAAHASARATGKKTAFLSHSHHDAELVKGLITLFQQQGLDLYIDWQDQTMPDRPNEETARKIKNKIQDAELFLFLATANSKISRWCPWEIGIADSLGKKIYIIPTETHCDTYGNEYLNLYSSINSTTLHTNENVMYTCNSSGQFDSLILNTANL